MRIIGAIISGLIFVTIGSIAYSAHQYIISTVCVALAALSVFVWIKKSAQSYRFLYPGMLCFALFTILPIFFTIMISFTNLGTGHFFSENQAREITLSTKSQKTEALEIHYQIKKEGNQLYLLTLKPQHYGAIISDIPENSAKEVVLIPNLQVPETAKTLSNSDVFNMRAKLKTFTFKYKQHLLSYHRSDLLMETYPNYSPTGKNKLDIIDNESGIIYQLDKKRGNYVSSDKKKVLLPGFYTLIGLKNYTDLFSKDDFKQTFIKVSTWTFTWALVSVFLTFSLGMSLAIFLNDKNLAFKSIYRNLLILPYSIPFFISVLVFKGMLSKDFGVINQIFAQMGYSPIPWLEDALWAKVSCLMVNLWLGFPYMFLLTTGILQSIPTSVYEAAKIDGANKWQSFRSITFPMILSSITPLLIGSFAFNLGNFVGIYLLTGGGPAMLGTTTPAGETDILISYTYRLAFEGASGQMFGLASSIALFIFAIISILTIINFKIFNVNENDAKNQ